MPVQCQNRYTFSVVRAFRVADGFNAIIAAAAARWAFYFYWSFFFVWFYELF